MKQNSRQLDLPGSLEDIAFGCLFLTVIVLSLIRVDLTDTPWHLATAKYAFTEGHWPVRNTFSYTYPDYPLYQQYPVFQTILYIVYSLASWEGLSLLLCGFWIAIFILWLRWANPGSALLKGLSLAWMLAILGMHQRMILRPDIVSILLLVVLLLFIDLYRRSRTWVAALFVVVEWLLVNSHQLFPLGLAIQGSFFLHLILVRRFGGSYGVSRSDGASPVWPLVLGMVGSALVCLISPLGTEILKVPGNTAGTLLHHKEAIDEFAPFYTSPYVLYVVICATCLLAVGLWRRRKECQPFDVFLWLVATAILSAAIRGVALYVMVCVGVFGRSFAGGEPAKPERSVNNPTDERAHRMFRVFCAVATLFVCGAIVHMRWVASDRILGGTQPGIGLSLGVWPGETIRFLKANPPPGRMINLTWYSANPLILELFPRHRVFVDPRFESYPREFLRKAVEAGDKREALDRLIDEYRPGWMVTEVRSARLRKMTAELMREGGWSLVHVDSIFLILVRNIPENSEYISRHRLTPEQVTFSDFLWSEPDLMALQELRLADLYVKLGMPDRAGTLIREVQIMAQYFPSVRRALEKGGPSCD